MAQLNSTDVCAVAAHCRLNKVSIAVFICFTALLPLSIVAQREPKQRMFRPEDLFRVRQINTAVWSPNGSYVAIELTKPDEFLGSDFSNEILLLDVKRQLISPVSPSGGSCLGFFDPMWSPTGSRLAFFSVDANAVVRAWIWTTGKKEASPLGGFDVRAGFFDDAAIAWAGDDHLALLAWDLGAKKNGDLYREILRGPNAAQDWKRAVDGRLPSVSVLESGRYTRRVEPSARLVIVDLRTNLARTLRHGPMHNLVASKDGRFLKFNQEEPGVPGQTVSSYFALAKPDVDTAYIAVTRGTVVHVIEISTGTEVSASSWAAEEPSQARLSSDEQPFSPIPNAKWLAESPAAHTALYTSNTNDGSHLWLCSQDPKPPCKEVWHGNEWMQQIKVGKAESISYESLDGTPLTAWLLLPPDYSAATRVPMITIVYPGVMYDRNEPSDFSLYQSGFWEHPQLFAALGYAVLLPSMPPANNQAEKLKNLPSGVVPALDAVIERGIADPKRIAVAGQSDGGFATLGLITETSRFSSAIESAGFADLLSLYGTFYGQYRYGDAGSPEKGQVLRMLQMENGSDGLGGPPWANADLYRAGSAVLSSDKVKTPVMLIHGDLDFIPIQQAEEFFTALLRQDKRAQFVRYKGEWHTISNRANVLDLWTRVAAWLSTTMTTNTDIKH